MVDIKAANCIDNGLRMAMAKYWGTRALLRGDDFLYRKSVMLNFDTKDDKGEDSDSGSDTFLEEFLAKCGIYLRDKLYKLKHKADAVKRGGGGTEPTPISCRFVTS